MLIKMCDTQKPLSLFVARHYAPARAICAPKKTGTTMRNVRVKNSKISYMALIPVGTAYKVDGT